MQIRFTLRRMQYMAISSAQNEQYKFGVRKCYTARNWYHILRCNEAFFGSMDSSQHRSLHQVFRSLLTDRTNV